ncbi:MAG: hypothetical protein U9M95_03685 [Candidatus Altiarchaeota archaeon]|nr:hypothetical protein [Candidatus Altiarchaeota archaeon]
MNWKDYYLITLWVLLIIYSLMNILGYIVAPEIFTSSTDETSFETIDSLAFFFSLFVLIVSLGYLALITLFFLMIVLDSYKRKSMSIIHTILLAIIIIILSLTNILFGLAVMSYYFLKTMRKDWDPDGSENKKIERIVVACALLSFFSLVLSIVGVVMWQLH